MFYSNFDNELPSLGRIVIWMLKFEVRFRQKLIVHHVLSLKFYDLILNDCDPFFDSYHVGLRGKGTKIGTCKVWRQLGGNLR